MDKDTTVTPTAVHKRSWLSWLWPMQASGNTFDAVPIIGVAGELNYLERNSDITVTI